LLGAQQPATAMMDHSLCSMCVNLEASHFGNSAPLELLVPVEKPEAVAEMGDCIFDPIVTAIAI
jgi:hypothetical protein